jgi:hypothetical protein
MRFFGRNKKNARETSSEKAKARVSKRIARSKAPDSPKREIPVPAELPPPVEKQVFVEEELSESESESTISEEEEVERINLADAPMTEEEDGRSSMVFAQDFVEEFTDMVSEDAAKIAEKESYCCGGL